MNWVGGHTEVGGATATRVVASPNTCAGLNRDFYQGPSGPRGESLYLCTKLDISAIKRVSWLPPPSCDAHAHKRLKTNFGEKKANSKPTDWRLSGSVPGIIASVGTLAHCILTMSHLLPAPV